MSSTSGSGERALLERAFLTIEDLEKRLERAESARREPIAVVGMGCRVPRAAGPRAFWELLRDGVDVIDEVPADRWDAAAFHGTSSDIRGKTRTREGGFLADLDQLDAAFFGISPREADSLDPQQRLLLEVSWEALEHAALSADALAGSKGGVFMALCSYDYAKMHLTSGDTDRIDAHSILGGALSIASGRLSYFLDWKGPCLTLDTACSSSLVAIHLACQSLRERECDQALAGGAGVILFPDNTIGFSSAGALSPEGRCKTFDAGADGYVRGEGCGVVVLKRLSDALADGDRVLGVLRGSALTQDGRSNGLTAPSGPAQEEAIRQALDAAGVEPAAIDYVEAHGTGTSLGDPVEVLSLAAVMGDQRPEDSPLLIGSVKTNLGHTEAAAGVLGLIKVLLALEHGVIPPHLHLDQPNPHIPWDELPLRVTTEQTRWPAAEGAGRRLAGVSSFGFSGTNAHVVVEEAPPRQESAVAEEGFHLLPLSAKNDAGRRALAARHAEALAKAPGEASLADICFTAAVGRAHHPSRLAVTAASIEEARHALSEIAAGREAPAVWRGEVEPGHRPRVVFLFSGQGTRCLGMGRGLFDSEPVFRRVLERCNEQLGQSLDRPLLSVLYPEPGEDSPIGSTAYTQPALFAVEVALAELWRSWGIEPAAVFGHSAGELAAACVAGAFGIEEGLAFAEERGRLMAELSPEGAMAAVFTAPERVAAAIAEAGGEVEIAAFNGPTNIAISGSPEAVAAVCEALRGAGVKSRALAVDRGFHSPLIDPVLPALERAAARLGGGPLRCQLISNLSGVAMSSEEIADPAYWCRQAREPVRFTQAVDTLRTDGFDTFLEIGPEPTVLAMARRAWPADTAATWLPSLRSGGDDRQQALTSLGAFYVHGFPVRWEEVERGAVRRVNLPTYPWQRKRHWLEIPEDRRFPTARPGAWDQAVAAGSRQAEQGPLDLDLPGCVRRWELLNELTVAFIAQAFRELGVFTAPGEAQSAESLIEGQGIASTYRHLLGRWLRLLADAGFLETARGVGAGYVCPQPLPDLDPESLLQTAREAFRHDEGTLEYFERCGSLLAKVLRGETSALETLFPGGSWHVAEHLYNRAPQARYMNAVAVAAVEGFLRDRPAGQPLRVLEIGAGTGGTAAAMLTALPPQTTRYVYTDVSDFFLARAAEKFAEYPFITYRRLDLETPPQEQDFPTGTWDLVISANCVHAVRDLDTAIGHIGELLADDGLLLLYETTAALTWLDITTGLIEGWQLFEDGWRIDTPLLSAELWIEALKTGGFEAVEALPREGSAAEVMGQHILLARRPAASGARPVDRSFRDLEEEPRLDTPGGESAPPSVGEPTAGLEDQISAEELRERLSQVTASEREELLVAFVRQQVIRVLRLDPEQAVSRRHPLLDLGLDSLLAVELRNRLQEALPGPEVPATLVFDYPTVEAVARFLGQRHESAAAGTAAAASEKPTKDEREDAADLAQEIDAMSDDEAEARLLDLLDEDPVEVGSGGGS